MATFASSDQAKMAAGEGEEEVAVKTESRRLNTTEVTSMFNLRSELQKKKFNTMKSSLDGEYALKGKSVCQLSPEFCYTLRFRACYQ